MTTDHPDLELLSALLDGIDEDGTAAHVDTCDTCQATVAALRRVSVAVGAPVDPPGAADAEQALTAAMAALPSSAEVVAIRARPHRLPRWALAVAAAVLVVAAGVPLVAGLARDKGPGTASKSTSSAGVATTATPESPSAAGSAGALSAAQAGRPADLGALDDADTLRSRLRSMAAGPAPLAPAAGGAGGAAASGASGQTATGQTATGRGTADSGTPAATPSAGCTDQAGAAAGAPGAAPVLSATLVWRGTPALLYAFTRPDGASVAAVVAPSTCTLLVTVSF